MDPKALWKITYGLYVVSAKTKGKLNGQIANTVFQVTSEPPTLAVSINKQNFTHECIRESKAFAVSVLSRETPLEFIGNFGFRCGRDVDKLKDVEHKIGLSGVPVVLENAVAYIETEIINSFDCGSHTVFLGKVTDAEILNDQEPLTYDYYHKVKRGTAPKTAPTYIKETSPEPGGKMQKYRCTVCGYIYDPQVGDPDNGVKAGTPFESLPADWVCPVCGAAKTEFEKMT